MPLRAGRPAASGAGEVLVVLALALLGLLLAAVATLAPWYPVTARPDVPPVVDLEFPRQSAPQSRT